MKHFALLALIFQSSAALALSPSSTQFVERVASLDPALIAGSRAPKWEDFNTLAVLGQSVSQTKSVLAQDQDEIAQLLQADARVGALIASALKGPRETQFSATEYELKLQYTYLMSDVNSQLPSRLRIPFRRVAFDQRRKVVNETGRRLVRQLEPKFETAFNAREISDGEKAINRGGVGGTIQDVIARIRESSEPQIKRATEILDQGVLRTAIRRPESARFWIPKVGFHNQYVTKTSRGMNDNDLRHQFEASLLGDVEKMSIAGTDPESLPKYGTLLPDPTSEFTSIEYGSSQYGEDIYFLKLANIQDRLSVTMDDSLSLAYGGPGWMKLFIPWKFKDLLVPLLAKGLETKDIVNPRGDIWFFNAEAINYSSYWEIQIFGSLRLSDVELLQFQKTPPSGRYLLELLKNDIKIFDGRVNPPKPWTPSAEDLQSARAIGAE